MKTKSSMIRGMMAVVLWISTLVVFGQSTERVVTKYPKGKFVKEVYWVSKADTSVRQGEYYSFYEGQLLVNDLATTSIPNEEGLGFRVKGNYDNNLEEGDWTYYFPPETDAVSTRFNVISEEGRFSKGKKTGVWNTYLERGKVVKRFDHDKNKELTSE